MRKQAPMTGSQHLRRMETRATNSSMLGLPCSDPSSKVQTLHDNIRDIEIVSKWADDPLKMSDLTPPILLCYSTPSTIDSLSLDLGPDSAFVYTHRPQPPSLFTLLAKYLMISVFHSSGITVLVTYIPMMSPGNRNMGPPYSPAK